MGAFFYDFNFIFDTYKTYKMKKIIAFLFLIISIYCTSQNTTSQNTTRTTIEKDSIKICPFDNNCGYYKGEIANGKANGKGRARLKGGIAEGHWKDNRLDGFGTYEIKNYAKYAGNTKRVC